VLENRMVRLAATVRLDS